VRGFDGGGCEDDSADVACSAFGAGMAEACGRRAWRDRSELLYSVARFICGSHSIAGVVTGTAAPSRPPAEVSNLDQLPYHLTSFRSKLSIRVGRDPHRSVNAFPVG
jgi:hypothetical protein